MSNIKLRIVGKAVFTTINKQAKKSVLEKEEKEKLKALVEKYNVKPSQYWLSRIMKYFPDKLIKDKSENKLAKNKLKTVKKEKQAVKKSVKKNKSNKAAEILSNDVVSPVQKAAELKEVQKTEPSPTVGRRFGGEY